MTEPAKELIEDPEFLKFIQDCYQKGILLDKTSDGENGDSLQSELIAPYENVLSKEFQIEASSVLSFSTDTTTSNTAILDDNLITSEHRSCDYDNTNSTTSRSPEIRNIDFSIDQRSESCFNNDLCCVKNSDKITIFASDLSEKEQEKLKALVALGLIPSNSELNLEGLCSPSSSSPSSPSSIHDVEDEIDPLVELDLTSEYCLQKLKYPSPNGDDRFPDLEIGLPYLKNTPSQDSNNSEQDKNVEKGDDDDERSLSNSQNVNDKEEQNDEQNNHSLVQQQLWTCETCKTEIPEKDLEMHLFFHPISGYPTSAQEELYLTFVQEQKFNSIPKVLCDSLLISSMNEELPISDSVEDDSSLMDIDKEPDIEEEAELESSQSTPVHFSMSPPHTSVAIETTTAETSTFVIPKTKPSKSWNTTTTTTAVSNNNNKTKTQSANDIKLKEFVEKMKRKNQAPPAVIEKIGWSTTPGVQKSVEKIDDTNSKSPSHSSSSASSISSSSCSSSPAYYGSSMDENVSPSKKTNDNNNYNNRPRILTPPKKKTIQDKLKVKFRTPKESLPGKNSTENTNNSKKISPYIRKNNNNSLKNIEGIKGKAQQDTKQKNKSVQGKFTTSASPNLGGKSGFKVNKTGKKRPSKSTSSTSERKRLRLSNTAEGKNSQMEHQNNAGIPDTETQRTLKEVKLIYDECLKSNPSMDILLKSMEATFRYRMAKITTGILAPDIFKLFPALKYLCIIKRDFELLKSIDLSCFEVKLLERFTQTRLEHCKNYRNGTPTGDILLDNAEERMRSLGCDKELFQDILALTFGFSKCGSQLYGTLYKCRDKGEKPFKGQFPSIDICGELGTESCKITLYCDDTKVTSVPTFYEAIIFTYAMHWVFSIYYEQRVEPLFKEFDSILQI